ncbi:MAG: sodium:solute symporter, partial [Lentisphaeria bacterium]|nr:sodium:solute symporter [Lentisphaeria bacterium]
MIMLVPLAVIVIMRLPEFQDTAKAVTDTLAQTSNPQLRTQGLVPTALSMLMPTGLLGLFVAVMFAAMLSTDDTYMHSWGSIFIQDVLMPFRKKVFSPKQHILALRLSIVFVAVFAWLFSYFFRQTEYVFMFFAITGAIVSGAGAVLIGGLYWKFGTTFAAWVTYITGAVIAVTGIILQQVWHFEDGSGFGKFLYETFGWEWLADNLERFPINGQWLAFISSMTCVVLYFVISLIEHAIRKTPAFNLDKMLHRGIYDIVNEHEVRSDISWLAQRLGIIPEFTRGDKLLYAGTIGWTLLWLVVFIWFTAQHFICGVSNTQWLSLWHVNVFLTLILGIIVTIWFLIGGLVDVKDLFNSLGSMKRNDNDDGSVINGSNAGECVEETKE